MTEDRTETIPAEDVWDGDSITLEFDQPDSPDWRKVCRSSRGTAGVKFLLEMYNGERYWTPVLPLEHELWRLKEGNEE